MPRARFALVPMVVAVLLGSLAQGATPPTAATVHPTPPQEVVLLTPRLPLLLRLQLSSEGESPESPWGRYMAQLFAFLDVDHDGVLSAQELKCMPHPTQVLQLMQGHLTIDAAPPPTLEEVSGDPKKPATLIQVQDYYRRHGVGSLYLEVGSRLVKNDALGEVLWSKLDLNHDGQLSRTELEAASRLLPLLDENEDDTLSIPELLRSTNVPPGSYSYEAPVTFDESLKRSPLILRNMGETVDTLSQAIFSRYNHDRKGRLRRGRELDLPAALFGHFDQDRDGEWTNQEMKHWLQGEPDVEVRVSLNPKARPVEGTLHHEYRASDSPLVLQAGMRGLYLRGRKVQVEFLAGASPTLWTARNVQDYKNRFNTNANKEGILKREVIYRPPFAWIPILRLVDRDGDECITRKELDAWLEVNSHVLRSATIITISDRGTSFFELVDADHDARLGPRDLLMAWERLRVWDRNGDGVLTKEELPQQYQLVVSQGSWRSGEQGIPAPGYGPALRAIGTPGPAWFRKMDRNGDGDISPREFLGRRESFNKLDRNGDGLIDLEEAEHASGKR